VNQFAERIHQDLSRLALVGRRLPVQALAFAQSRLFAAGRDDKDFTLGAVQKSENKAG
jgi:hypothetical protein